MTTDTTNENRRKDDAHPAVGLSWPTDVMIDIETMGTTPGSAILSIGAVMFGPAGLGDEFYAPISLASCTAVGLTMDPNTVTWWMKQSDAARAAVSRDDAEPLPVVLQRFTCWFKLVDAEKPWCQGANFDAPLLEAAYRACGMTPPWKFWNVRDTRTLYEQADVKVNRTRGTHHNALDDARAQAEAAVVALQRLRDARAMVPAPATPVCTCPSGDGSLRWPCPVHPAPQAAPAQGDPVADFNHWMAGRGPLGAGAHPSRAFIAGHAYGRRAAPSQVAQGPAAILQALRGGIPLQEPVYIGKALRAQREARVCLSGGTGPLACVMLVNIQLTPWIPSADIARAFAEGYNRALKEYRGSLLDLAGAAPVAVSQPEQAEGGAA